VDLSNEQSQYPLRVYRLFLHPKSISKLWILSKEKANPSCGLALFIWITKWSRRESNPRPNKEA
jgi:hypothetical protein